MKIINKTIIPILKNSIKLGGNACSGTRYLSNNDNNNINNMYLKSNVVEIRVTWTNTK